jgi:uncharacterized protein (TIGR03578 family)
MYQELEHSVTVNGTGETKHLAFQQALTQMKKKLSSEIKGILLQIEPRDLEVLSASQTTYKERFLGILFPRTRVRYDIQVKIQVALRVVDLNEIEFAEKTEPLSVFQRVLKMR